MADLYIYAVARIRKKETELLNTSFLEQLLNAKDEEEALRLLREHGWGDEGLIRGSTSHSDAMLSAEEKKTWQLMGELVPDLTLFDVFRYEADFHNLKAAVKEAYIGEKIPGVYETGGTLPPESLRQAVKARTFQELPEQMHTPAEEAMNTLLKTGDGQLCDLIIDRAALETVRRAGKSSGSRLLELYGELTAAIGDIRIASRGSAIGKDPSFLEQYMADCSSLNVHELVSSTADGKKGLISYLKRTPYGKAADELEKSQSDFERWCDDYLMDQIHPELYNSFGPDPLAAYILARKNEIKSVRIILAGKRNSISQDVIRSRVRRTYVN